MKAETKARGSSFTPDPGELMHKPVEQGSHGMGKNGRLIGQYSQRDKALGFDPVVACCAEERHGGTFVAVQ